MRINPGGALKRILLLSVLFIAALVFHSSAQTATVEGSVKDSLGNPIDGAYVGYFGSKERNSTNSKGDYSILIPAGKEITLVVDISGYEQKRKKVTLSAGQTIHLDFILTKKNIVGDTAIIKSERPREFIPPKIIEHIPGPNMDISAVLRFAGAQSSNELSNQYSVRGGNFDENLVYVNDIEVYRPFLTRSGQQEGLSFVNVDMTGEILFFTGGFDANYGDKMSSVLDIHYRRPSKFKGVASASLLGFSAEVEGSDKNSRFTWMIGIRNKSNRYLLRSLDTRGDYRTNFNDVQTYLTYAITDRWSVDYLGSYAENKYNLIPSTRETDFGTLNNALRFTVYFDGQEVNRFQTTFNAVSLNYHHSKWRAKFILSSFNTYESETFDVQGQYYIDQLEADFGKPTFGQVAFNRGVGTFLNHARNYLDAWVNTAEIKTWRTTDNFTWQFGLRYENNRFKDEISEWNYVDSSGYSIPFNPTQSLDLQDVVKTHAIINSNRYMGYAQMRYLNMLKDSSEISLTIGVRANYWDLNGQLLISPRAQLTFKPHWKQNITFRAATGLYSQPPFYRELRKYDGTMNTAIRAQTSVHGVLGSDWIFKAWGRDLRFGAEAYYKYLDNLIPYEVNDVRIRYFGDNMAHGYAYGLDLKLNGQIVDGVESWMVLSILRTRENLYNDNYYLYLNSDGDTIIPGYTFNNVPQDSILQVPGLIPRPTDQLVTFSLYFQDYLPVLPDCKMNLGLIIGTGLPFGPPTHERYKGIFRMPPYRRVDIGFSYEVIKEAKPLKETNPFHFMKSLWIGVEVYNLLQVQNTLSYYWVKDVTGRSYAIPNYLTNRQLSARMIVHF
ncbi:MAG: TonB-dependent receptor [Bacteroidota bacterium]|nr:TonB-dependent receptor [Bacteroidota bacterium]